jgi:hypothetical protein
MPDPMTVATVASSIISGSHQVVEDLQRTRALLALLKEMVGAPRLPYKLLQELFLEVKFNLGVLDALPNRRTYNLKKRELKRDPTAGLVEHLRLDALSAIVHSGLEVHQLLNEAPDSAGALRRMLLAPLKHREQKWEKIAQGEIPNLLGICTKILTKAQVLQTLQRAPTDALRDIDGWKRLRSIHWLLLYLLRSLKEVVPDEQKQHVFGFAPDLRAR